MTDENNNPQKDFDDTNANRPNVYKKILAFAKEKGFDYEKHYSIKELFEIFHPCYKETYLENGRLYQRNGYE